ncbi:alpha/beta fold hydrolase [Priestia megaterium]|jgi:non-heme chloroperoxidase|uniref:alpha/beta fold hydrolase n=1 Tax=Priestia megaterium TaxID=1404 RepID=UPI001D1EC652|nr:alpha/beta hydrolase [Priestia megaterium]CAH0245884.1 Arylesterase [Priestia megaterium]
MNYFIHVTPKTKLFVRDIGKGEPVLFLHGWPVNAKMYEYQFTTLPARGIRCIAPDLRGFGKSDAPFTGYSYNQLADDIRMLVERLELKNYTLVGFSMGGAIAIRYMSRHLGYGVKKLILLGAAAPSFIQKTDFPYGLPSEEVNTIIQNTYRDRPNMLEEFGKKFFNQPTSSAFRGWFQDLGLEASGHGTIKTAVSLRDEDLREDLSQIFTETYILHGKKDQICPFDLAKVMNRHISFSTLLPFENSGHGLFYDEREKVNDTLIELIAKSSAYK